MFTLLKRVLALLDKLLPAAVQLSSLSNQCCGRNRTTV